LEKKKVVSRVGALWRGFIGLGVHRQNNTKAPTLPSALLTNKRIGKSGKGEGFGSKVRQNERRSRDHSPWFGNIGMGKKERLTILVKSPLSAIKETSKEGVQGYRSILVSVPTHKTERIKREKDVCKKSKWRGRGGSGRRRSLEKKYRGQVQNMPQFPKKVNALIAIHPRRGTQRGGETQRPLSFKKKAAHAVVVAAAT